MSRSKTSFLYEHGRVKIITVKTASDFVLYKGVVVSTYLDKDIWNPAAII